jgi:hypothetical protein
MHAHIGTIGIYIGPTTTILAVSIDYGVLGTLCNVQGVLEEI